MSNHGMGLSLPGGTPQHPWRPLHTALVTSDAALSAVGAYSHLATMPAKSANLATGGRLIIPAAELPTTLGLKFFGAASGGAGTARLWGLSPLRLRTFEEILGDHLLDLSITLDDAAVLTTGNILPCPAATPTKWADAITVSADESLSPPGARVFGNSDDGIACVCIDGVGYAAYVLELKVGTCTGLGGVYRFF
jgi:hypothetical protein